MQPDFGAAMSLAIIAVSILYIGGIRSTYLFRIFLVSLPLIILLIVNFPYRFKRVTAFIDPWKDPYGNGYQLIQSFTAFGNGGLTGVGLGESMQKLYFLPESHTDFIFSIIGEEFGLIGSLFVLSLFIWLIIKGWKIAINTKNPFGYYLSMGITIMIGFQSLINFCVTTGLMPTKGLPLPFISYGGSSLLINMISIGILINIANSQHVSKSSNPTSNVGYGVFFKRQHERFNKKVFKKRRKILR
ncbi:MAG: hypothetical protein D6828_03935 [Nitrospirae bacterium]|nr:MAG: hypothetical protein D6828_03935 [Nitrospirota bacterium]